MPRPRTLTRGEFARTPAAKRGSYKDYLSWLAAKRPARMAANTPNPWDPTPEPVLRSRIQESVKAQIDPLIAEITKDTDRQAGHIDALTRQYASRLEPYAGASRERFGRARSGIATVSEALANRIAGAGQASGEGLAAKLNAIDAPDALVSEVAGGATEFGRGAGNAGFAADSAVLEELFSRGAGAEDFSAALPGFANLEGIGHIGRVRGEAQRQVGEIRSKVPSLVAELLDKAHAEEFDKALAKETFRKNEEDRQDKSQPMPDSSLSNTLGYLVDQYGRPLLDASGNPIPTQGAKDDAASADGKRKDARATALTNRGGALAKFRTDAFDRARDLYKGDKSESGGSDSTRRPKDGEGQASRKTWRQAYEALWSEFAPPLQARYGLTRKQIGPIIVEALKAAGFTPQEATPKPGASYPRYPGR